MIAFTHFIHVNYIPTVDDARRFLYRCAGLVCKRNNPGSDLVLFAQSSDQLVVINFQFKLRQKMTKAEITEAVRKLNPEYLYKDSDLKSCFNIGILIIINENNPTYDIMKRTNGVDIVIQGTQYFDHLFDESFLEFLSIDYDTILKGSRNEFKFIREMFPLSLKEESAFVRSDLKVKSKV